MKALVFVILTLQIFLIINCKGTDSKLTDNESPTQNDEFYQNHPIQNIKVFYYTRNCSFTQTKAGKILTFAENCIPLSKNLNAALNTRPIHEEIVAIGLDASNYVVGGQTNSPAYLPLGWGALKEFRKDEMSFMHAVWKEINDPDAEDVIKILESPTISYRTYREMLMPKLQKIWQEHPVEEFNGYGSIMGKICMKDGWNCQDLANTVWKEVKLAESSH